nr:uncharacterized histidine-rich protein DDB_G0274557-like [Dermatophagoides farinae]
MQKSTIIIVCLAIIFVSVDANLIVKSKGKKSSDLVMIGDKCQPTIVKSGDKKGKNSDTIIMNPECHHKEKKEYVAYPVYHEYPSIIHEYHTGYGYDYGHNNNNYGHQQNYGHNDHNGYHHGMDNKHYGYHHGMDNDHHGYYDYYRK